MSLDQSLITPLLDNDLFAPSWLAGVSGSQALAKTFKSHDVEAVDVVKTCDKLSAALMENSIQHRSEEDGEKQCAVRGEAHIPFRTCTNLWYGTLKIYQQQVNTLFRLSQDLVLRSTMYDIKSLDASKRKSSSTSHSTIKKRRLTISETNENTYVSSNYSELLDDLERLTQDTTEINIDESTNFASTSKSGRTRPLKQIQIREITIREIDASTYSIPEYDPNNDDTGFGEATQQEVSDFFNFFQDKSKQQNKKTATKRKAVYENEPPAKYRYNHDSTIEPVRNENISAVNASMGAPRNFRSMSPTDSIVTTILPINPTFVGINDEDSTLLMPETNIPNYHDSSILLPQNCNDINNNSANNDIPFMEIKEEIKEEIDGDVSEIETNHEALSSKKKKSKLIIDKCIKIEQCEIMEQMKRSADCNLVKVAKKRIFKKLKNKKSVLALELLARFNRRAIKQTRSLKQKLSLKPEQVERDYLNLLYDIFKTDYIEEWASVIFPKWQQTATPSKQRKSKRGRNSNQSAILDILDENLNIVSSADLNNNNNNATDYLNNQNMPKDCNEEMISMDNKEWRPYGVMVKLLDMWHYSSENEIDAVDFCNSAKNQTNRALAFYSLLSLCKNQYIALTKRPKTIVIDKVLLGKTTEHLIHDLNSKG